jgi:uncharacterized protein (DUF2384 family)
MPALENPRHEAFAAAYVELGWNATRAYKKAYTKASAGTCATNGSSLLRKTEIFQRIEELTGEIQAAAAHVHKLAQHYAVEAIEHLVTTMRNPKASEFVRIRAAETLIERGLGKAVQQLAVNQNIRFVIEAPAVVQAFELWAAQAGAATIEHQPEMGNGV